MSMLKKINICLLLALLTLVENMINYRKLTNKEKHSRFNNMKSRCSEKYQKRNPRYNGVCMCAEWSEEKYNTFFAWLDENYYEVAGEQQMDIDKDILQCGNKQYHPELCLIVPHSINAFYERIEVGKTNIVQNLKTKKYGVRICNMGEKFCEDNFDTYNDALDAYCAAKQKMLVEKAEMLKSQVPEKVYLALMNTDIKVMNQKYYRASEGEV